MKAIDLETINDLIAIKDFETAKVELEKFLELNPDNIEALKSLGLCNINLGQFKQGQNNFETVVKYKNDDATSWFYLANCYDNLDDYLHAKTAYLEVIKLRENYLDAYKNLCVVYIKDKENEKALEIANKGLSLAPEDYIFYYLTGTIHMTLKEFKESIPFFEKAIELKPDHAQIFNNLGTVYLTLGQYDKANENYLKSTELEPRNSITFYNIGSVLQIQNKHKEACEYFQKAYALESMDHYLVSLALSAFKSEQYDLAIEKYKLLISLHPEKNNFQYNLACCYEMIGECDLAIGILAQLFFLNPNSLAIAQKLANLQLIVNQPMKAKNIYEELIATGNVSAEIYYEYAMICVKTKDLNTAEAILKKVIELKPEFAQAHKDLGVIYLSKRLFDYAKEEFEKAYQLSPDEFSIIFEYANFLHSTSDFKKAQEFYEKALEKNPNEINALIFNIINLIALNNLSKALEQAQLALKISSDDDFLLYTTGKIYYLMKDFEKAQFLLIKSWEKNPTAEVENLLALNYFEQNEFEKANEIFLKLLKSNELNTAILLNSAKCYEKLADFENAKKQLKKALKILPELEEAKKLLKTIKQTNT